MHRAVYIAHWSNTEQLVQDSGSDSQSCQNEERKWRNFHTERSVDTREANALPLSSNPSPQTIEFGAKVLSCKFGFSDN